MALFVKQNEERSELQSRVAAELQERLKTKGQAPSYDIPESNMTQGQHQTRTAGLWIAGLICLLIIVIIWAVMQ